MRCDWYKAHNFKCWSTKSQELSIICCKHLRSDDTLKVKFCSDQNIIIGISLSRTPLQWIMSWVIICSCEASRYLSNQSLVSVPFKHNKMSCDPVTFLLRIPRIIWLRSHSFVVMAIRTGILSQPANTTLSDGHESFNALGLYVQLVSHVTFHFTWYSVSILLQLHLPHTGSQCDVEQHRKLF